MAKPRRPERNGAARSFGQLRRFHHGINSDNVFGTHRGERVVAVVQPRAGCTVDVAAVSNFVKQRVGSVKTPKQIEVWDDLPRSKVGKVLTSEIRARMLAIGKT